MNPRTGGRVICELASSGEDGAVYRTALYTPQKVWQGLARIRSEDGHVSFSDWDAVEAPAWLIEYAESFLRAEWKVHARNPVLPWSGKIARWRAQRS